jgi:hypothetical protein
MVNSIFFVVTLVMTAIGLHRHRQAGKHCLPGRSAAALTEAKNEMPQGEYPVASAQCWHQHRFALSTRTCRRMLNSLDQSCWTMARAGW